MTNDKMSTYACTLLWSEIKRIRSTEIKNLPLLQFAELTERNISSDECKKVISAFSSFCRKSNFVLYFLCNLLFLLVCFCLFVCLFVVWHLSWNIYLELRLALWLKMYHFISTNTSKKLNITHNVTYKFLGLTWRHGFTSSAIARFG